MKKLLVSFLAATAGLALTLGVSTAQADAPDTVPAAKLPAPVSTCSGVWVVVDTGSATTTRCATKYSTGLAALASAGFTVKTDAKWGMVCQLNGNPSTCGDGSTGYWAYYHAEISSGKWGAWNYYTTGAGDSKPVKGTAEGWRWTTGSDVPRISPPKPYTATPTPTISGTLKVGKKLTAKVAISPKPTYSYQWYRGSKAIKGATKASYTLVKADKGKTIKVKVTAKKSGYQTVSLTSKATKQIK
ncbi:MAG: hypothetical protein LBR20_05965 [Propionibacteriaceae bacterium]|jgi:hypothetical protein|nr:hypothetical protein [Propionibacteriaceae bacterium]